MFISLKWKALFVTCVLFSILFAGRAVSTYLFFSHSYKQARTENILRNSKAINSSIENTFVELQNTYVDSAVFYGTASLFNQNINPAQKKNLDSRMEETWWKLQLERDITTLAIYNHENRQLATFGNVDFPSSLILDTNKTEQPASAIVCHVNCFLYSTAPILINGKNIGAVIYGTSFSTLILKVKGLTNSDVALINQGPSKNSSHNHISNWNSSLLAITDSSHNTPMLMEAADKFSLNKTIYQPETIDYQNKKYEVVSIPLSTDKTGENGIIILISDVTESTQALKTLLTRNILYDGAGLLALGLCLVWILWRPMNKLRTIAMAIPQLGNNAFDFVRNAIDTKNHHYGIMDESDSLSEQSIALTNKLESLHNQIQERNAELEYQGIQLKKEHDFATKLLNTAHAVIIAHDYTGTITMVNEYACEITGYKEKDLVGEKFSTLFPSQQLPENFNQHLDDLLINEEATFNQEADLRCKDGNTRYMSWYHSALRDPDTTYNNILTVALDISERKIAEDHLGWLASHDTLTSLFNRRRFHEELEKSIAICQRHDDESALLFIDLDNFKDVNDTSGHQIGDLLLKQVASTLLEQSRDTDVVARFGGDEFAMLLQQTTQADAELVARRICTYIAAITVSGNEHTHHGSCSIGVAMLTKSTNAVADLLAHADLAMYKAKKSGRNNWFFYDDTLLSTDDVRERVYWDKLVKTALSENLITIYFQPIMNIKQRHISHYECLMRICEGDKILPPVKFIEAAEASGLMAIVDEHIITLAFKHKKLLEDNGIHASLAINLSGLSFQSSNLAYHIQHSLEEYSINAQEIIFEITETSAIFDISSSKLLMAHLKETGFSFALDDFGSGFSSLAYLKQFPIDYIKIDGAFIKNIDKDLEDQVLVKTIVDTAKAFKLKTIAEFVENQESLLLLESMGIDYGQGYYIDKPKPFETIWGIKFEDAILNTHLLSSDHPPSRPGQANS